MTIRDNIVYPYECAKRVSLDDTLKLFEYYVDSLPNELTALTVAIERLYFKVDIDTFEKLRKLFCGSRVKLFQPQSYATQLRQMLPKPIRIAAVAELIDGEKYDEVIEAFSKDDERLYSLLCYAARYGYTTLVRSILQQTKIDMRIVLTIDDAYVQFCFMTDNPELWEIAENEYVQHHPRKHGNYLAELAFESGNLKLVERFLKRTNSFAYFFRFPNDDLRAYDVSSIYDTRSNLLPLLVFPRSIYFKWRTCSGCHELV